jgi:cell division GTPase FtsZ
VNVLLLSAGGGGGNILRSVKALFRHDLAIAEKADPKYADRLRRAVSTRFLDTNEFSLLNVLPEERVLIGASTTRRFGARHDPELARAALEESREEVERLVSCYSVVILIASGGKGTGAGTVFPIAEMVRRQRKLIIPIFVRPSFEHHEVEKQRYDQALRITDQFDAAKIRLIEILNERGYVESDPQPQAVVWERMNAPIARGLRGLLYVLSDLSQVDPSDLSMLFAGEGRLRMGFAEVDPDPGIEPSDAQIDAAARACWDESYYAFRGPVGTSLICIQGDWSNLVDARIKRRLAALAVGGAAATHPYNPLYARADRAPKPWGVTGVFAEYTGPSASLELDWTVSPKPSRAGRQPSASESPVPVTVPAPDQPIHSHAPSVTVSTRESAAPPAVRGFATLWEFALALNRQDAAALAIARDGVDNQMAFAGMEVRKLLTTVWFRSIFPSLSAAWRERLLAALVEDVITPNHVVKWRRGGTPLRELSYADLKEIWANTFLPEAMRVDLELLLVVGRLWGDEALSRLRFAELEPADGSSKLGALLHSLRQSTQ